MTKPKRPGFWSALLRKQPIERGVYDPIDAEAAAIQERFKKVSADLSASVKELIKDNERRRTIRERAMRGH